VLDVESKRVVDVLERLPTRVASKWVVCCYLTDKPARDLCGMCFSSLVIASVGLI